MIWDCYFFVVVCWQIEFIIAGLIHFGDRKVIFLIGI